MEKLLNKIKKIIPARLFKAAQPVYHFLLSFAASVLYGWPSESLIVIGVTGTTGKTTSVFLIAKTLEAAGFKVGYTSTAMFNDGAKEWLNDKKMTMMGRFFTQKMLRNMLRNKCQFAIIETTSEGIKQFRHRFIDYDVLVFTGLYAEHIDSHGGFENYKKAKGELFAHLKRCRTKYVDDNRYIHKTAVGLKKIDLNRVKKTIIVNADDKHADYFLSFWAENKMKYEVRSKKLPRLSRGTGIEAARLSARQRSEQLKEDLIIAENIEVSGKGTNFAVNDTEINLQLLGEFNVFNAMAAVCVGLLQGMDMSEIKSGLKKITGVPGRLERIDEGQNFVVIIDYAFEPNAVKKLYETIKLIPHKKVIHVLGSTGGGRDASRRPKLGKLAGENADIVIVTNEDPYDEDPQVIIDAVADGALKVGPPLLRSGKAGKKLDKNLFKISDRRKAIKKALSLAEEDDIVLITGKGSEQAICVANGGKIIWDDRAVVRGLLVK